jgi:large subunit ribosomal protein L23
MKIVIKPVVTEASMDLVSKGWYTFAAPCAANKNQLRELVEKTFEVEVTDIKTMIVKGKMRRSGRTRQYRRTPDWKKVMVKLKESQKIDLFDQA